MTTSILQELRLPFLEANMEAFVERCGQNPSQALDWWLQAEVTEKEMKRKNTRLKAAKVGRVKPMTDFDWDWPSELDQGSLKHVLSPEFYEQMKNVIIIGPEGLGKTMIAKNLVVNAIDQGYKAMFVTASALIGEITAARSSAARESILRRYTSPHLLVIDEIGYVTYTEESAFCLFEVISRRYEKAATAVTTNLAFKDWGQVFPSVHCVASLVDRLYHHAVILRLSGKSYRLHEHRSQPEGRA